MACYCGDCPSHQPNRSGFRVKLSKPAPVAVAPKIDYSDFSLLDGASIILEPDYDFDLSGRNIYKVAHQNGKGIVVDASVEDAILVGSRVPTADDLFFTDPEEKHKPVIDIDVPVRYVPSTTEGHGHLYIDKEMTFDQMVKILEALVEAGVVEYGYLQGVKQRGAAYVRLPWVQKIND